MNRRNRIPIVPESLHRLLKARAAMAGRSLSDYLLREMRQWAEAPTPEEIGARLDRLPEREYRPTPTEVLRRERDNR